MSKAKKAPAKSPAKGEGKGSAHASTSSGVAQSAGAKTASGDGKLATPKAKGVAVKPGKPAPAVAGKPGIGAKSAPGKVSGKPKVEAAPPPPAEPAGPKKWPKGGPSKSDLKRYREKLLEMRRALLSSSNELAAEALKSSGQEFSVDHMADHGSDNYEQDFSLKLLEGESAQLAEIREALMKIDGKLETPFGLCEACADSPQTLCETCPWIPPSRLEVLPHARLCVQTKEIEESRRG